MVTLRSYIGAVFCMRIPKIHKFDTSTSKETVELEKLEFESRFYDLGNDKQRFKYVSTIERLCRSSLEYKEFIEYLKNTLGMNYDSFFHKVSRSTFPKARLRIEIHHEPFTLYDIVSIVLNDRLDNGEPYDMFTICDDVMRLHYEGKVGLIPLSETVHELVHSGKIFIPLQFIDIGFNDFYNEYMDTIKGMDGLTDMLNAKVALSKEFAKDPDQFTSILKKKYTYVANQGYDAIPEKIEK